MDAAEIIKSVQSVTKDWAKQRKAEERSWSASARRRAALTRSTDRYTIKDAAAACMEAAYLKMSGNGERPAHARQIMYATRGPIQESTGKPLDDKYFTQSLLPAYLRENQEKTAGWDVVFDARGHFREPHTGLTVPLGTIDVRRYLSNSRDCEDGAHLNAPASWLMDTHGPQHRFGAILFIEKEGFEPLFRSMQLAERFDIAIMSTKGMSVTAARQLVDRLCGEHDIPLLLLHDFDKSGFSIAGTLQRSNHRFQFKHEIRVIDLGLRLLDVQRLSLESESVAVANRFGELPDGFSRNLRLNGATKEEIAFLAAGQRVELNAMTSPQLVEFIETKLEKNGIKKLVPDEAALENAFRRALQHRFAAIRTAEIIQEAQVEAAKAKLPKGLAKKVRDALSRTPGIPWDQAVSEIVAQEQSAAGSDPCECPPVGPRKKSGYRSGKKPEN